MLWDGVGHFSLTHYSPANARLVETHCGSLELLLHCHLTQKKSVQQRAGYAECDSTAAVASGPAVCLNTTLYRLRTKMEFYTFPDDHNC